MVVVATCAMTVKWLYLAMRTNGLLYVSHGEKETRGILHLFAATYLCGQQSGKALRRGWSLSLHSTLPTFNFSV